MTTRPASLIRQRDFVKLWTAETISQFGTQVSLLAVPLVAVTLLEASPFEVALLGTVEFLPFILFSLPAGAWVDRLRRRPILIAGDLGRAVSLGSIPLAYALGALTIWQLYIVGFVSGVLTVLFDVSYQSYLPSLVERDQLAEGNSKLELSRSLAQITGPAIGGGLIGLVTAPLAIVADAVSYLASALFVTSIRRHEPAPDRHHDADGRPREGMRREVGAGLRYVLGNPYLRGIAAATGTFNLFGNMIFAVFIVYAVRELGLSAAQIGLILGLGNLGAVAGALGATRLARRFGVGPTIVVSMLAGAPSMLMIAIAPRSSPAPLLIAAGLLASLAGVVYNINQVSFRQAITPAAMQGRMNATMRFIVWGTIPLGQVVGGTVASVASLSAAIWIGALGTFVAAIPLLLSPVRSLRVMPTSTDPRADTMPAGDELGPLSPVDPPG